MIYFVESIPGGGKSFYSRKLYKSNKNKVIYYKEEYRNPIDFVRQAVLSEREYKALLFEIGELCENVNEAGNIEKIISKEITRVDDYIFVPYLHIIAPNEKIKYRLIDLYMKEYDDGMVSYQEYSDMFLKRLKAFLSTYDSNVDYIFEGALLHNPLLTIMGFYNLSKSEIVKFYNEIYRMLDCVQYEINMICVNSIEETIKLTAKNRVKAGDFAWQRGFEKWLKNTKKYSGLKEINGIISFAEKMNEFQKMICEEVPFQKKIIERRI